jgi:hypothetical protein
MSMLMATCPQCRTETNTGIFADKRTIQQLGPRLQVLVLCGDCSEYQKMLVEDLHLTAEEMVA